MTLQRLGLFVLAALFTATGAHAQIAFRGAASAGVAAPSGGITFVGAGGANVQNGCGTANPGIPGGLAGDLLIAVVEAGDSPTVTMAGWNTLFLVNPNGNHTAAVFWRIRTGGDPNAVVQSGGCNVLIAQVAAFRGVDATLPFYTAPLGAGNLVSQSSGAVDTGTQATGDANAMLVYTTHVSDDRTVANAGGFAEAFDSTTTTGNDVGISLAYRIEAAPGNKGPFNNMDLSGGGNDWNTGALFALRPAPLGLSIALPPGTVAGDVMVAAIVVRPSSVIFTPPAGWAAQSAALQNASGNTSRQQIFYKVAGGAEPAGYTWLFDSAHTGAAGGIVSYSGVDTAAPFDAFAGNLTPQGGDSNLQHRALAVTTTVVDTMVISTHSLTSAATWTAPAGMTERVDVASQAPQNAVGISISMHEVAQAAAGSTGDKVATAASNGDTGSATLMALRPLVPQPVLHWSLDQLAWNGTPGEVADLSASGLHGTAFLGANTAFATPAIGGSPGTCRYGVFDGVDDYVEVADNPLLDITDELTVMMWVRPTAYPGAGLKTFVSKDQNYEAHLTPTGTINWWWGGGALELNSAGAVPLNQWTHVTLVYSRAGAFQRIYRNGVQDANTNNQAGALVPNNMPFQIASDQGFAGRQFPGWIDEVYVFRSALTQSRVQQYMNTTRPCASLMNHFNITHAGSGVGCVDQPITFTAHDAAHNAVDANALNVTLSTTNAQGTWTGIQAGGGVLNDPVPGDGVATYTFPLGSNSATLLFRYSGLASATETFGFNISGGGFSETTGTAAGTEDPSFTMAQAGFRFRNIDDANETILTQISGKPSNAGWNARTVRVQAINTNTSNGSCTNLFANQTQTVQIGGECIFPATCAARQVGVNGTPLATSNNNGAAGAAAYTDVSLGFNAASEADTVILYPDAGAISLHAQFDLNPLVAGFEMIGSSNPFIVRPFGLAFPGVQHGTSAAAAILAAAGDNFALTLRAYQWAPGEDANNDGFPDFDPADTTNITDNGDTPNFAWATAVGVAANLPGIATGVIDRASGGNSFIAGEFAGGTATANDWRYSEAGNAELLAISANYISAGVTLVGLSGFDGTGRAAGHVGRFKPKSFALTGGATLTHRSAPPGCAPASTFTYLGEELTLGFTLEARNAQNVLTQNYTGAYAKLNLGSAASLGLGARDGVTNLTARVDSALAPSGSFTNGVANLSVRTAVARATPDDPDGPFAAAQFGIAPNDADPNLAGGVQMGSFNLDVDGAGGNDHAAVGPTAELRYGRLLIGNAYGPEQLPLPMPIRLQYWNGGAFDLNGLDSCTNLAAAGIGLSAYTGALAAGESVIAEATIAFAAGTGTLTMTAPGVGNAGSVLLTPDLAAAGRAYLQGRWSGAAWNQNPSARAAFGVYGQPRNFIFFRENY